MIIGECPYEDCEGVSHIPCAERCPVFSREACESCGRTFWLLHSRVDPKAYTEQGFHEEYEVDFGTGRVKKLTPRAE